MESKFFYEFGITLPLDYAILVPYMLAALYSDYPAFETLSFEGALAFILMAGARFLSACCRAVLNNTPPPIIADAPDGACVRGSDGLLRTFGARNDGERPLCVIARNTVTKQSNEMPQFNFQLTTFNSHKQGVVS